jgi:hypothetical protein
VPVAPWKLGDGRVASAGGVALAATALVTAAAAAALAVPGHGRLSAVVLSAAQTIGVLWLLRLGSAGPRGWATATFVTGATWVALFLVPCWAYSLDPGLLPTSRAPEQPVGITTLSLFALIAGLLLVRLRREQPAPDPVVSLEPTPVSTRAVVLWAVFGLACLGLLMLLNGGPIAYVSNLHKSAQLNGGLLYLIWVALFLRFAPLAAIAARWSAGRPAGLPLIAAFLGGSLVILVTGARGFLAVAVLQALLLFALVRRPIPLRRLVLPTIALFVVIVFGIGSLKRYQAYSDTHPGTKMTLPTYLVDVAPREAIRVYVDNYVSGVATIGAARRIVPAHAGYEYGKAILRLGAKVIPRSLRPSLEPAAAVKRELEPGGGYVFAIPLQATAYLQFGLAGVIGAFAMVGALLAAIDRRLERSSAMSLALFLPLMTLAVQVPLLLRSGVPAGAVFLLMDVVGMWLATITVTGTTRAELARQLARLRRRS